MTGKIDPKQLASLVYPARPDPLCDALSDPGAIRAALGVSELGPSDMVRIAGGCVYSPAAAEHFVVCCEQFLRHSKGRWAGQPLTWHEWQLRDWVRPIFGWITSEGLRAINRVYIECGKKSGKSTFAAAVAAYMAIFFGEIGAEVYCLAGTEHQARIVQLQVEQCIRNSPQLEPRARIRTGQLIQWPQTDSYIEAKSGKGASGFNPFALVMDELHEWQGASAFERWTYGSVARDNWLHLAITNAGDDEESVCYRQRSYCQDVMTGRVSDPSYYGRVYSVPRELAEAEIELVADGATDLPVARQTNPGLGTILRESDLLTDIRQAIRIPSNMANLLRFRYCVWRVAGALEWLNRWWDDCGDDYTLDDLQGQPCWIGMDLSSVCDMSAVVLVARDDGGVCRQWPLYFVPRQRAAELRKYCAVEVWEHSGHLVVQPGNTIDQLEIARRIVELCETHDVRGLVYDPKEATLIVRYVDEQMGVPLYPFRQSHENYHEPTDCYEGDIKAGVMRHPRHPILSWQAKHALCKETTHGYRKPIKPDPEGAPHKGVDGVQAAVMAFSQARLYQEDEVIGYAL